MADTRFPSFLRVAGSSSPPAANPQVERMIGVSDPYRFISRRFNIRHTPEVLTWTSW